MDIISRKEILQHVDHTLLAPTATWEELQILCDEAIKYETASVCVPPNRVKQVKDYLCGRMAITQRRSKRWKQKKYWIVVPMRWIWSSIWAGSKKKDFMMFRQRFIH